MDDSPRDLKMARLVKLAISRIVKYGNLQSSPKDGAGAILLVGLSTTTERQDEKQ
jgi:hypothetical protein